jgi:hypothetical protein
MIGRARVTHGNHRLLGSAGDGGAAVPGVSLAHFPIRSKEQLIAKVLIGAWNLRLRKKDRQSDGKHRNVLFQRIMTSEEFTDADLQYFATRFAAKSGSKLVKEMLASPVPPVLSYTDSGSGSGLRKLILFTEQCVRLLEEQRNAPLGAAQAQER